MKSLSQNVLITFFGALSSLLTAIALYWIEINWHESLYSYMIWYIFPIGSILAGILAASGYYLGSIFLHQKPTKMILLNMLIVSLGTYFLIQYLNYLYLSIDAIKISDVSTFWEYWDTVMLNTTLSRAGSNKAVFELGVLGYGFAFLQIIGFSMGGIISYLHLSSRLYCEKCSRYFAHKETVSKYGENSDTLRDAWEKIAEMLIEKKFEEAISSYSLDGGSSKFDKKKHHLQFKLILKICEACKTNCLIAEVLKWHKNDWHVMHELGFKVFSDNDISLKNEL